MPFKMSEKARECVDKFEKITGVRPKSGRLGVGSMRPYIHLTMLFSPEIKEFVEQESYYRQKKQFFNGLEIKYLGNIFYEDQKFHEKNGYEFIVELSQLK